MKNTKFIINYLNCINYINVKSSVYFVSNSIKLKTYERKLIRVIPNYFVNYYY